MSTRPPGLPPTAKMRHDNHYVEEISYRGGIPIGRMIPIEEIDPTAGQPRRDGGDLQRLIDSVREMGVLTPLLVRFLPDSGKYGIISGQRRYQAACAAGLSELPCIEKDVDDAEAAEIALTENLHHKELTPDEEGIWADELAARLSMPQEETARRVRGWPDPTESTTPSEQLASVDTQPRRTGEAVAETGATPEVEGREESGGAALPDDVPSGLDSELVGATERLLDEAKASILASVRGIAGELEHALKRYLQESRQQMQDFRETSARELKQVLQQEMSRQRTACIRELLAQSNDVVRDAVSRVRTETEEIVRTGCASISAQFESTTVALRECEREFQASTKADAQEGVDAFRKQVNLLADEILGQSRQAIVSALDDLRSRVEKAARTLQL